MWRKDTADSGMASKVPRSQRARDSKVGRNAESRAPRTGTRSSGRCDHPVRADVQRRVADAIVFFLEPIAGDTATVSATVESRQTRSTDLT